MEQEGNMTRKRNPDKERGLVKETKLGDNLSEKEGEGG